METPQTHRHAAGTATLPWKCNMVHRSCHQGKPDMSQYIYQHARITQSVKYGYFMYYILQISINISLAYV
jgi:hypothetical protein